MNSFAFPGRTLVRAILAAGIGVAVVHAQTKWHPGHYLRLPLQTEARAANLADISALRDEPAVKGVSLPYAWKVLEPTKDHYDFSRLDQQLAAAATAGKRLIVDVWEHGFGKSWTEFHADILPPYLDAPEYGGGWAPEKSGGCAKVWLAPVMDRYIALYRALAERYDRNPHFEMIGPGEIVRGLLKPLPADFSSEAYVTQWLRWMTEVRAAWPNTNVWMGTNFIGRAGTRKDLERLIDGCYRNGFVVGGPDIRIGSDPPTTGTQIINGLTGSLGDLRGKIALRYDHQVLLNPTDTPALLYENAVVRTDAHALRANYICWSRKTAANVSDNWERDVLPFLRSHPDTVKERPAGAVRTGHRKEAVPTPPAGK